MERKCTICGKQFTVGQFRVYCSRECRDKAIREREKEYRKTKPYIAAQSRAKAREKKRREKEAQEEQKRRAEKPQPIGLDFAMAEADRLGITYGQYMAMRAAR